MKFTRRKFLATNATASAAAAATVKPHAADGAITVSNGPGAGITMAYYIKTNLKCPAAGKPPTTAAKLMEEHL